MTDEKMGHTPFESAPTSDSTSANSTAPVAEALAWMAITGLMMLAGWLWEGA